CFDRTVRGLARVTRLEFGIDGVDEGVKGANYQYARNGGKPISASQAAEMKQRMGAGNFRKHQKFYEVFRTRHAEFFSAAPGKVQPSAILPYLEQYFRDIQSVFAADRAQNGGQGYWIGGYGSGLVCDHILSKQLVDKCWLAQSKGWPGYEAFSASNRWSLRQFGVTRCTDWNRRSGGRVEMDFNEMNYTDPDFGQWNRMDVRLSSFARPHHPSRHLCAAD
ncbi:MAG: hypothetical protein ACPGRD_06630, partial [Planktomarina sp.]